MVRTIHFMAHSNNDLSFNKQRPHSDLSTGKLSFNLRPKERMTENPWKLLTVWTAAGQLQREFCYNVVPTSGYGP